MWCAYKSTERPVPCARLRCRNAPTQNVRFEREGERERGGGEQGRGGGGGGGGGSFLGDPAST